MRTVEERDRQTLAIVMALVRGLRVVALWWIALAAVALAVDVDDDLRAPLLLVSAALGAAVTGRHLVRPGPGSSRPPGPRFRRTASATATTRSRSGSSTSSDRAARSPARNG